MTNNVSVPVTNLLGKPEAEATIQAAGTVVNTFLPGIGSIVALEMGGPYHGYRQVRNRKVNEALVQGEVNVAVTHGLGGSRSTSGNGTLFAEAKDAVNSLWIPPCDLVGGMGSVLPFSWHNG